MHPLCGSTKTFVLKESCCYVRNIIMSILIKLANTLVLLLVPTIILSARRREIKTSPPCYLGYKVKVGNKYCLIITMHEDMHDLTSYGQDSHTHLGYSYGHISSPIFHTNIDLNASFCHYLLHLIYHKKAFMATFMSTNIIYT